MTIFAHIRNGLSQKIVIDWSMTILKQPSKIVIDRSMTIFACIRNGLSQKIVIDRSMTILKEPYRNVIDWSMTFFVRIRNGLSQKIVIDWSMTIFGSPGPIELLKAENHSTLWTHHLWPYVIDHSQ